MKLKKQYTFWFVTGSQHLYGQSVLEEVKENALKITEYFNNNMDIDYKIVHYPTVKTKGEIYEMAKKANDDEECAGIITWMHTFSPSKMWINGLKILNKPLLHLHTQFNKEIPWDDINMNFMNVNQSAHGDREHGFIHTRLRKNRKVVVGHYTNEDVINDICKWMKVAVAVNESKHLKVARFGDNMRQVAVTEGDKVEAEIQFGWSVDYYGVGDLVEYIDSISAQEIDFAYDEMKEKYLIHSDILSDDNSVEAIKYQIKIELALEKFLKEKGYSAYTNTFEDLHGLKQLPGLASQRMMEKGYGFGPEGDWKVSAMLRLMKIISGNKGTTLMEDYTYHLGDNEEAILGAHMLEICPTIAKEQPRIEVHPLSIGDKAPPARLVFDGKPGEAICVSLVDMGGRFRLIILDVEAVSLTKEMPNLPVARVLWRPKPSLKDSAKAWIYAGGAHHTVFTYQLDAQDMIDFAKMMDIEYVHINEDTSIENLEKELMLNDLIWKLK